MAENDELLENKIKENDTNNEELNNLREENDKLKEEINQITNSALGKISFTQWAVKIFTPPALLDRGSDLFTRWI